MSKLYDALIAIKTSEKKARAAAQAATASRQFATKADMAEVKADLRMLKWFMGILAAANTADTVAFLTQ